MRALVQKLSPVQEAVLVTAVFVGWFIYSAMRVAFAGDTGRPDGSLTFDNATAVSLLISEAVQFACGALILRWRGWNVADFLFALSWRHVPMALGLLILSTLADVLLWQAVGNRLDDGSILRNLVQPGAVAFGTALLTSVVNGTFEEFFLCRYLIERFKASGAMFAVSLSAGIRMLYHIYQGPYGTLSVLAFGIIIGAYYWRARALGAVVLAHVLADLIALSQ